MMRLTRLLPRAIVLLLILGALTPARAASTAAATRPTVVAVIDNGVDPYHVDFAAPARTTSPRGYLAGYPAGATALRLHLHESSFAAARERDAPTWRGLRPNHLYWVPGTKIVGVIHIPAHGVGDRLNDQHVRVSTDSSASYPVLDGSDHGTAAASVAVGNRHGSCAACLLVVIAADDTSDAVRWAAHQPWIDVLSNSYGGPLGVPIGGRVRGTATTGDIDAATREAAAAGEVVVFASGNGVSGTGPYTGSSPDGGSTLYSPYAGPPWVLAIGAADPATGQPESWHDVPVDAISYGVSWPAAQPATLDGEAAFEGTSCAAPIAAGVVAATLGRVRSALGRAEGRHGDQLVRAAGARPSTGPLHDGSLTRQELQDAVLHAARPASLGGQAADSEPLLLRAGWGVLDGRTVSAAADLVLGRRAAPARPAAASWDAQQHGWRTEVWGVTP
jgi:subtilisin family serine protease